MIVKRSETRETNEIYRHWMKCIYPRYCHLQNGEKTKFTLSLVEILRRDRIHCQKCIPGSNELVEMSDDELRSRLAQALREPWVKKTIKKPIKLMESNEIPSFRNFFLQQEGGHLHKRVSYPKIMLYQALKLNPRPMTNLMR